MWVGAVTNVVRTCSPTPLFVLTVCTKAIKYVRMNLKGPGKRYYIEKCLVAVTVNVNNKSNFLKFENNLAVDSFSVLTT